MNRPTLVRSISRDAVRDRGGSNNNKTNMIYDEREPLIIVPSSGSGVTGTGGILDDDNPLPSTSLWQSIHFTRWQSFAGVCLYVSMAGTTYAFGVYSELLRTNLGFSQGGLDVVASVGNTGLYLSIIGGLILERYGLQFVVYFGGLLIFVGFFYIWLAVEGYVPADIASVSIFFFISQFGVCCHVSSAVTASVRLFPPESRGSAVGLVKGYFGLSSAVLSDFAGGYFHNAKAYFILFIAIAIPTVGIIGSSLANFIPAHAINFEFDRRKGVSTSLMPFFSHWMAMFSVLFIVGYSQYAFEFTGWSALLMPTVLSILLLSILMIPGYYGSRFLTDDEWHGICTDGNVSIPDGYVTGPEDALREAEKDALEYLGESNERKNSTSSNSQMLMSGSSSERSSTVRMNVNGSTSSHSRNGISSRDGLEYTPRSVSTHNSHHAVKVVANSTKSQYVPYVGSSDDSSNPKTATFQPSSDKSEYASYGSTTVIAAGTADQDIEESGYSSRGYLEELKGRIPMENVSDSGPECFYGDSVQLSFSIRTWRFWLLYVSFLTICGTGLMVIDNINAICDAVGKHPSDFYVSLVSLANGAGRVSAGFASDLLSRYFSKLELFGIVAAVMGIAQSMFAVGSPELLYPSLLLVGFLFGSR